MREKRKLSSAAVVLISVLAVIVLALSYLQFIDGPLNEQTEEAEMQLENAKQESDDAAKKLAEFAKEHGITLIGCIREDSAVWFT